MDHFRNILAYAGTDQPETAVARAAILALENKASLTLMDVVKPIPTTLGMTSGASKPEELERLVAEDRRRRLMKLLSDVSDSGLPLDAIVAVGDPATEITRRVLRDGYDLVVKTADGFSPAGRLFSSVAKSLLRLCPCPVWLLKPQVHGDFDRVLAAIDVASGDDVNDSLNQEILGHAYSIARRDNAQLHVVSAWQLWMEDSMRRHAGDDSVDALRKQQEARVREAASALLPAPAVKSGEIHLHIRHGSPASVIRSVADEIEADLMVMGSVCQTGIAGFLIGSTAETVLADLTCSLLALKPNGFVSPIEMSGETKSEEDEPLTLS